MCTVLLAVVLLAGKVSDRGQDSVHGDLKQQLLLVEMPPINETQLSVGCLFYVVCSQQMQKHLLPL
jgi:hypothetical protein